MERLSMEVTPDSQRAFRPPNRHSSKDLDGHPKGSASQSKRNSGEDSGE